MKRVPTKSLLSVIIALIAVATGAIAQNYPGQIPDPSSYKGSMELQRREQESARQNAPQPQPGYTGPSSSSSPSYSGPAQPAAPQIDWASRPALPAARNPLIGRWQPEKIDLAAVKSGSLIDLAIGFFGDVAQASCDEMFGGKPLEFRAEGLVSTGSDGRQIITKLAYRADGADVIALQPGTGEPPVRFTFEGRSKVSGAGCPMSRLTAVTAVAGPKGAARTSQPPAAPDSVVTLQVGAAAPGRFLPFSGANFYLLKADPDAALAKAGFSSVEAWLKVCKTDSKACVAGMQAMTGTALANVKTDAAGNAALPPQTPGTYYLFGLAPYEGHSLIWHRPVAVSPGPNNVFLDQTNATAG